MNSQITSPATTQLTVLDHLIEHLRAKDVALDGHGLPFTHEDLHVSLRLGQRQRPLQRRETAGDVALRLVSERLQREDFDDAPRPPTLLRRYQEALQ